MKKHKSSKSRKSCLLSKRIGAPEISSIPQINSTDNLTDPMSQEELHHIIDRTGLTTYTPEKTLPTMSPTFFESLTAGKALISGIIAKLLRLLNIKYENDAQEIANIVFRRALESSASHAPFLTFANDADLQARFDAWENKSSVSFNMHSKRVAELLEAKGLRTIHVPYDDASYTEFLASIGQKHSAQTLTAWLKKRGNEIAAEMDKKLSPSDKKR
ncbi:MAG: hypothetical protein LBR22_06965 [Desulfovibrio sp.]|jgi:hypothetical protein|nr:hypothetical protein [Desulfovibrio sp.]